MTSIPFALLLQRANFLSIHAKVDGIVADRTGPVIGGDGLCLRISNIRGTARADPLRWISCQWPPCGSVAKLAVLVNPTNPAARSDPTDMMELQAAARVIGRKLVVIEASTENELETAFASLVQQQAVVSADQFFFNQSARIAALAARRAVPAIYEARIFAQDGGLLTYGPDIPDQTRTAGVYAGRILKGEKPADLPVIQPVKFEMVINLKTAKALGLTIPETLLATADEVIQ